MAYASVNTRDVLECTLSLPRRGVWVADVRLDGADVPTGPATLLLGAQTFTGTFRQARADGRGRVRARIVGGAGGLPTQLQPRGYYQVPVRVPLADALREAGEVLSTTADPVVLDTALPWWTRRAGPAAETISLLAEQAGMEWRTLPDGSVWFGAETWTPLTGSYQVLAEEPEQRRLLVSSYTLPFAPGRTLDGRRISNVEHRLDAEGLRTTLYTE